MSLQRPHPPAPKPEKANTTSRVVRRAKSAVAMRGKNNGNGGSRIVPRFRIFGSSAGGGGNGLADIGGGGRSNVTAEVRPRSAAIARSVRVARWSLDVYWWSESCRKRLQTGFWLKVQGDHGGLTLGFIDFAAKMGQR